jgi:transcription-repair coupling factor (superfamily II helicase)
MGLNADKVALLKRGIREKEALAEVTGVSESALAYLLSLLLGEISNPCLVILPSSEEAGTFYKDLEFFFHDRNERRLLLFPSYNISPLTGLSPPKELISQRIEALYSLATAENPVVVTSLEAIMTRLVPKDAFLSSVEYLAVGEDVDRDDLIRRLVAFGYFRTSLVEERSDFSVRGGVIDLYSPLYDSAVRVELWGDTVESIRFFDPVSQRSMSQINELTILPANEIIQTHANVKRARSMGRLPLGSETGGGFPGQEGWIRHFYPHLDTVFDYLPEESHVCLVASEKLRENAQSVSERFAGEAQRFLDEAEEEGRPFPQTDGVFLKKEELEDSLAGYPRIDFFGLPVSTSLKGTGLIVDFGGSLEPGIPFDFQKGGLEKVSLAPLSARVREWVEQGNRVVLICRTEQQAQRLKEILLNYHLVVRDIVSDWPQIPRRKGLYICLGHLSQGFRFLDSALTVITEDEIFGEKKHRERRTTRDKVQAIPWTGLSQLKVGDLIVHQDHGIGRYGGLSKMEVNGRERDFVTIEYADHDRLYIPADRIDRIQQYVGVDDEQPLLDRLGGRSWIVAKQKAKKAIDRIAKDLVKIYSMRKFLKGFAFSKPDNYFREFEATFEYEETPDQVKAIEDVCSDMESERPMDRLICGDVGFGKTEVAIRACFKAVMDGKQVAFLVPTTVLAEQHYQTFTRRFRSYPVKIAVLSRFISSSDQKRIIRDLARGEIDIVIGTHKILSESVIFKDLGLLIIDEEQRFGVRHKEKLKRYRHFVDVLAMTATPIPRTFHMSLIGVRDLSIMQTSPADRLSIQTYVSKFDEGVISHAVERELDRKGQIFFVHNRVQTIAGMADRLKGLVPGARIDIAHGQMRERDLEKAMMRFLNRETDVLVCTTIIDSGLDIPSANTIIINDVDRFGLAEIYQLRGRVGRADVRAYAYLLISATSTLTNDAQKRLKVLMDFSQLGSGVNIALHDLRIRGGGNILGFAQSGHIKAIGYELYLKLIEQSIAELKGEVWQEEIFPEINTELPVFIPHDYIQESDVRLEVYRRLSVIKQESELDEMVKEIQDRFGPMPQEVLNLISVIRIKVGLKRIGAVKLDLNKGSMIFSFYEVTPLSPPLLAELVGRYPKNYKFLSDRKLQFMSPNKGHVATLDEAKAAIGQLSACMTNN